MVRWSCGFMALNWQKKPKIPNGIVDDDLVDVLGSCGRLNLHRRDGDVIN